jgi:hypothetical protein
VGRDDQKGDRRVGRKGEDRRVGRKGEDRRVWMKEEREVTEKWVGKT